VPNFGPGIDQIITPAVTPTWVFTPTPGAASTVRFYNTSNINPVYVGGPSVTQFTGMPLYPGNRPIELSNANTTMYVSSGVTRNTNATGTLGSASTAGTTAVTLAAIVPAGLAAGTTILIGSTVNTSGMEPVVVNSTTASSQLTFATPLLYDHAASTVVYTATAFPGSVRVTAGVV